MNTPANAHLRTVPDGDQETLVLGELVRLLIDQIWWVIGITVIVFLGAVAYANLATPIYSADALVQVEQQDSTTASPLAQGATALAGLGGQTLPTEAEMQVIQSRDVLGPVVHQFKLEFSVRPVTFPILGSIAAHFSKKGQLGKPWLGLTGYAWGGEALDVSSLVVPEVLENKELTLTALGGNAFELSGPSGQTLLTGTAGQDASANGIELSVKALTANPGTRFTIIRANDLDAIGGFGAGLKVAEQGKQTGVIQISLTGPDPLTTANLTNAIADSYLAQHLERKQEEASKMLRFLDGELPRLKTELTAAEARLSAFQQKSGTFRPTEEAGIYLSGAVEYEKQIGLLKLQETQLAQRYTRDFPAVKAVEGQIRDVQAQRDVFLQRFRNIPINEANSLSLQRDAKVSQDIYVQLLSKVQELSLTKAGTVGNVRILDRSLRPATPIKPKKELIESASVFLGLILGALFVFGRKQLTVGIEDPEAIERKLGLPMMGAVPLNSVQVRWDQTQRFNRETKRSILAKALPKDPSVEALRSFRTSLQFALADAPNKVVSLSGPVPGTGKSFVSVNLATLLAEAGQRVLLVDGDMRRGHLNDYFGVPRFPGLSEVLAGQLSPKDAIFKTDVAGLSAVWTGVIPDNPAELLMSPRATSVFADFQKDFDVVIVDTPPVLAVTDATIISRLAGTSFLVFRSGMHSEREVAGAIKTIAQSGGRLIGGVFNAIPSRMAKYGKYGAGNYHYVYQYDSRAE